MVIGYRSYNVHYTYNIVTYIILINDIYILFAFQRKPEEAGRRVETGGGEEGKREEVCQVLPPSRDLFILHVPQIKELPACLLSAKLN